MKVTFVGAGYVGLVSAAVFADLGSKVSLLDIDKRKISLLRKGKPPFFEKTLQTLIQKNLGKTLFPTTSYPEAIPKSEIVFICVNTLSKRGRIDFSSVFSCAKEVAKNLGDHFTVVVVRSTVWPGITEKVGEIVRSENPQANFAVLFCPEFLSEGRAVEDTLFPSRIIIGGKDKKAIEILKEFFAKTPSTIVITDFASAELTKYAANSFLATKISFINEFSRIAERVGADIKEVARGLGLDPRIGKSFLEAGLGFGGSCLPKDLEAIGDLARTYGGSFEILEAVREVNHRQHKLFVEKIRAHLGGLKGKKVTVLGLSFKPGTDDLRKAVALEIIERLRKGGAKVSVYDPLVRRDPERSRRGGQAQLVLKGVRFASDPYAALEKSDCLALVTEWEEFARLDFEKIKTLMRTPLVADGRNLFAPQKLKKLGFTYVGMGRV